MVKSPAQMSWARVRLDPHTERQNKQKQVGLHARWCNLTVGLKVTNGLTALLHAAEASPSGSFLSAHAYLETTDSFLPVNRSPPVSKGKTRTRGQTALPGGRRFPVQCCQGTSQFGMIQRFQGGWDTTEMFAASPRKEMKEAGNAAAAQQVKWSSLTVGPSLSQLSELQLISEWYKASLGRPRTTVAAFVVNRRHLLPWFVIRGEKSDQTDAWNNIC